MLDQNDVATIPVFADLKSALTRQWQRMSAGQVFYTQATGDDLWEAYLGAFPAGSNPIHRKRAVHDCSCCRHFVRTIGNVVAIVDGKLESLWDAAGLTEPSFQIVAAKLAAQVKAHPIANRFLHYEAKVGTDRNHQDVDGAIVTWDHFHVVLPLRNESSIVVAKDQIGPIQSEARARFDVLLRSLLELKPEAVETVLSLIDDNALYRGEEHQHTVRAFRDVLYDFRRLSSYEPGRGVTRGWEAFVWLKSTELPPTVSKIRNISIGQLLVDLSEGVDVERAVGAFERMVAPANYKRPKALVTPAMIARARDAVEALSLTSALERRFATLADVSVNNVIYADRGARKAMKKSVFDDLAATAPAKPQAFDGVQEVSIDTFLSDFLPGATMLEVMVENRHASNFVSLIAPADPTAQQMFMWDNGFSWSYAGDMADSDLRKEVQSRGGRVDGVFRFSHMWNYDKRNSSLMDLHVFMPGNSMGPENLANDFYGNTVERVGWNARKHTRSGGVQDVDYVAEAPAGFVPVENITFPDISRMPEGRYLCRIHNWNKRTYNLGGFKAEIEFGGNVYEYEYDKPLGHKQWISVAEVTLRNGTFTIKHYLPEKTSTRSVWGVDTQQFRRVNVVMFSPNHWDDRGVGNRHYFFMLDGCKNDGTARGFYNEFLSPKLAEHRKVLELVGAKMRTEKSPEQLSGVGFSSTQRNSVVARVTGQGVRTVRVTF